jgi:hypothetical protein
MHVHNAARLVQVALGGRVGYSIQGFWHLIDGAHNAVAWRR